MSFPTEKYLLAPRLRKGDTIGIVAPAGIVDRARLEKARQQLDAAGFLTKTYRDIYQRRGYLAGNDQARADELMAAFDDPVCRAIFPARGGYGCVRLLDLLDFDKMRANPKIFVGFSDNTVLHAALWQQTGLVTFHGPHPSDSFGSPDGITALTEASLWQALLGPDSGEAGSTAKPPGYEIQLPDDLRQSLHPIGPGAATGTLVGGNLALICSLMGTPYELDPSGCLLLLEDTDEPPYRVDRLLAQLRLAGYLDQVAGVLLGAFTRCDAAEPTRSLSISQVFDDYFGQSPYPVLAGFPCGHQPDNVTLPHGALISLDADQKRLTVLQPTVR